MTNGTNSMAAGVSPGTEPGARWLVSFAPDDPVFLSIDVILHLVAFVALFVVLRTGLRWLAREEGDAGAGRVFLALSLILALVGLAFITPYPAPLRFVMMATVFLFCLMILRMLCALSLVNSLLGILILSLAGAGLGWGLAWGQDQVFRRDRITLRRQMQKTLGLINDLAGRESAPVFTAEMLSQARAGLRVQQESLVAAVYILRNPGQIEKLTFQHTEDLKALDLIADGRTPSPDELAELGITLEEQALAAPGLAVLHQAGHTAEVSEADVQAVAQLLRSTRPPGSEVTPQDVALVIHEARKRARAKAEERAALAGGDAPASSTGMAAVVSAPTGPETARVKSVAAELPARSGGPLDGMGYQERQDWLASRAALKVEAVLRHGDVITVLVNRQMIKVGDVYEVEWEGKKFPWRLLDAADYKAHWEPVITSRPARATAPVLRL